MSMSVDFHLNYSNKDNVKFSSRVYGKKEAASGQAFATFLVKNSSGRESQDVTFYLDLDVIQKMKAELTKMELNLKWKLKKETLLEVE